MVEEQVTIAADGARLSGTLRRPDTADPQAYVCLNGATGVPARFYAAFASWLADEHGLACLTFDYRDFGTSGSPQDSRATMADWGIRDQQAARDWMSEQAGSTPLWVIGHSLGGMMLPYQTGLGGIDRVIVIASGAVHVSDHPWPQQLAVRLFWAPGLVTLSRRLGRFPGRALRQGNDLPTGVYAQWRRWCTSPAFHREDPGLPTPRPDDLTCDMKIVAVSDDVLCPPTTVWRLMTAYPQAMKRQLTLKPEDYDLSRLGHIRVFAPESAAAWSRIVA